ncbi:MAG: glycoside hydrolase family 2 protein, partial [Promethearchaeota archaeon]
SPCYSLIVGTIDVSDINQEKDKMQNNIIFFKLIDKQKENKIIYNGFRLFSSPKHFKVYDPELTFSCEKISSDNTGFKLTIHSKKIALYVFIDSDIFDFIATDNFFSMVPDETRTIIITDLMPLSNNIEFSEQIVKDSVKLGSLYDLLEK